MFIEEFKNLKDECDKYKIWEDLRMKIVLDFQNKNLKELKRTFEKLQEFDIIFPECLTSASAVGIINEFDSSRAFQFQQFINVMIEVLEEEKFSSVHIENM